MGHFRRCLLTAVCLTAAFAGGRKFYFDDPIWGEPDPMPVGKPEKRDISDAYDLAEHTLRGRVSARVQAGAVNTLGEVPDSAWYQNRHSASRRMHIDELVRGPAKNGPPSAGGPWRVISGKTDGATPGLVIEDVRGRRFLLKFDPPENHGMTTGADVIGSKFFHALGYNVPENYIVRFAPAQLTLTPKTKFVDPYGRERIMNAGDLNEILADIPDVNGRGRRALASAFIGGDIIGPFLYRGTRADDPNDIVPHEHRRDLRGLYVFAAWLNHYDATALNTLDTVVEENGLRYIKHYLIDFGSMLGSSALGPRAPRSGNAYLYDFGLATAQLFTLGMARRSWQQMEEPRIAEVGRFGSAAFDPRGWRPIYANPAFDNRLPEDTYWAAKKVMAFTPDEIRAIVATGEYQESKAVEWITQTLTERQRKIGQAFLSDVLPLDNFRLEGGRLEFDDLAVQYNFRGPQAHTIEWFRFDNATGDKSKIAGFEGANVPHELLKMPAGSYFGAEIRAASKKSVTVYFRREAEAIVPVGIERRP